MRLERLLDDYRLGTLCLKAVFFDPLDKMSCLHKINLGFALKKGVLLATFEL